MPITTAAPKVEQPLPGENPASNPRAQIGGNNPPPEEQVRIDFREGMIEKHPTYEQRIEDLKAAAERAVVDSAEAVGKAGDLVKSIRAMKGAVNDTHKTVKEPYLLAGRVADGEKNALIGKLDEAQREIEGKQNKFLNDERERIRKEHQEAAERAAEAERLRREAEGEGDGEPIEAAPAPAPIPEPAEPIRSADTGLAVSVSTEWHSQVEDYAKAFRKVKDDAKVREAIDAAIRRIVKATKGQPIPGVRIWDEARATTR